MAENSSGKRVSISFTLPISCQICLGKVKQPVVCPNHHVFCNACIELWLQHNQQCPTCRVPITPDNPCKQIIGQNQENESDSYMSSPSLRRARFDILYQDCEHEIKRLKQENERLKSSNVQLQEQLADTKKCLASQSEQTGDSTGAFPGCVTTSQNSGTKAWGDSGLPSPRSSPSASKLMGRGKLDESTALLPGMKRLPSSSSSSQENWVNSSETSSMHQDGSDNDAGPLAVLRSKLKQATLTYKTIKLDMNKLKEKNIGLSTDNRALLTENGRLKQAAATHSPRKYERYTSMAQQSKLDSCRREVSQLTSALERSDAYIDELETELEEYKSLFGSLPRKRPRHGKESSTRSLKSSTGRAQSVASGQFVTDLTFRSVDNSLDDIRRFAPPASSGGRFTFPSPLAGEDVGTSSTRAIQNSDRNRLTFTKKSSSGVNSLSGRFSKDGCQKSPRNKAASRVLVLPKPGSGVVGKGSKRNDKDLLGSDDDSDLDRPNPVTSTPSTAMEKLTLDSAKRLLRPPAPDESPESKFQISQSCHRQLDFGQVSPEIVVLRSSLEGAQTHGLMLEGNIVDVGPLDQNVTFSDLDFTLTSEISDCAKLMKEAEKRVKQKRLSNQEGEAGGSKAVTKSNVKAFKTCVPSKTSNLINKDTRYFAPVTCTLNRGNACSDKPTSASSNGASYYKSLQNKGQDMKSEFGSGDSILVTCPKNHPGYKIPSKIHLIPTSGPSHLHSGAASLSADKAGRSSQSANENVANSSSHSSCKPMSSV